MSLGSGPCHHPALGQLPEAHTLPTICLGVQMGYGATPPLLPLLPWENGRILHAFHPALAQGSHNTLRNHSRMMHHFIRTGLYSVLSNAFYNPPGSSILTSL